MITVKVYRNRDNTFSLELNANNVAVDITGLTRVTLTCGDLTFDSSKHASVFDWASNGTNGELEVDIGRRPEIVVKEPAKYKGRLTVYDATYPNGLVWDDLWLEII